MLKVKNKSSRKSRNPKKNPHYLIDLENQENTVPELIYTGRPERPVRCTEIHVKSMVVHKPGREYIIGKYSKKRCAASNTWVSKKAKTEECKNEPESPETKNTTDAIQVEVATAEKVPITDESNEEINKIIRSFEALEKSLLSGEQSVDTPSYQVPRPAPSIPPEEILEILLGANTPPPEHDVAFDYPRPTCPESQPTQTFVPSVEELHEDSSPQPSAAASQPQPSKVIEVIVLDDSLEEILEVPSSPKVVPPPRPLTPAPMRPQIGRPTPSLHCTVLGEPDPRLPPTKSPFVFSPPFVADYDVPEDLAGGGQTKTTSDSGEDCESVPDDFHEMLQLIRS